MKTRILFLGLMLILASLNTQAQQEIEGVIVDDKGKPVESATVRVRNEKDSVLTDAKGRFRLNVSHPGKTVIVEKASYTTREFIPGPVLYFEIILSKRRNPGRLLELM